jgi:RNA polymerase sigma factor (sigma-70 family)
LDPLGPLIERATRGDCGAVEGLLALQLPALRAFVRLRVGPKLRARESASDLVQSVCREILENADRYDFRGAESFKRWLFTTALRVVRNKGKYWAREKRDLRREALAKEEVERFERAFESLSEDHQEAISLSRIVGLPHQEIAEQMGRTEAAVRQLLHRALAARVLVYERMGGEPAAGDRAAPDAR